MCHGLLILSWVSLSINCWSNVNGLSAWWCMSIDQNVDEVSIKGSIKGWGYLYKWSLIPRIVITSCKQLKSYQQVCLCVWRHGLVNQTAWSARTPVYPTCTRHRWCYVDTAESANLQSLQSSPNNRRGKLLVRCLIEVCPHYKQSIHWTTVQPRCLTLLRGMKNG